MKVVAALLLAIASLVPAYARAEELLTECFATVDFNVGSGQAVTIANALRDNYQYKIHSLETVNGHAQAVISAASLHTAARDRVSEVTLRQLADRVSGMTNAVRSVYARGCDNRSLFL